MAYNYARKKACREYQSWSRICSSSLCKYLPYVVNFKADEQQVTASSSTPLCDVLFAADIDDINVSSYVSDENEFVLKGKNIRLVFSSPKRHDIIQVI